MWKFLSTTAIALALSFPAWAQTGAQQYTVDRSNYPFLSGMSEGAWTSDTLIGKELTTADGEEIGEIESVVFGPDDRILGLVVDAGEYMGLDEDRPVAVDWYAVSVVPEEERLAVDLTKEQLTGAPEQEEEGFVQTWRQGKQAEVPDIAESQPGVITGEDVQGEEDAPDAGAGGTD